jgi:two-component system CheB/CheR fusion protein
VYTNDEFITPYGSGEKSPLVIVAIQRQLFHNYINNQDQKMSPQMRPDKSLLYDQGQNTTDVNLQFEILLDYLKHNRGCDLTSYKRPSLMRRFQHRMQSINIDTYQSYLKYLQSHSEEYLTLQNEVLINVSSFFRDHDAWNYLAAKIIPQIIASKQPDEPIRVWSAGCAAGQEICSLLILLAEALGIESCSQRVQCYATDVDKSALVQARQATYSQSEITDIPLDWQIVLSFSTAYNCNLCIINVELI